MGVLMVNKESLFASLHILMRAIPDGPADAGRRLHRYWYRESRCQVRTGWQKPLWLHSFAKSAQSASKFSPCRSLSAVALAKADAFCAFLWLKNPRNLRNPWLINYLCAYKAPYKELYICRDNSTDVESSLQINLFMQNEPNFRKSQMNVSIVYTKVYVNETLGQRGKNEPKTNPNEPNQSQLNPIKANKMPKQTQYEPNQTQCLPATPFGRACPPSVWRANFIAKKMLLELSLIFLSIMFRILVLRK